VSKLAAREPDARYLQPAQLQGTLVDSGVLIDVLADDPTWADWSLEQLDRCGSHAPLIINPLILAELSPRFERAADLEAALAQLPLPGAGRALMNRARVSTCITPGSSAAYF